MRTASALKFAWIGSAIFAPIGFIQQTVQFKRLFALSSQAVDARAKLDDMQKAALDHVRQIGEARQGIADTEQALASLETEISGLTVQLGDLIEKR